MAKGGADSAMNITRDWTKLLKFIALAGLFMVMVDG